MKNSTKLMLENDIKEKNNLFISILKENIILNINNNKYKNYIIYECSNNDLLYLSIYEKFPNNILNEMDENDIFNMLGKTSIGKMMGMGGDKKTEEEIKNAALKNEQWLENLKKKMGISLKVTGGILIASIIIYYGYEIYKKNYGKYSKKCKQFYGKDKSKCILKCEIKALEDQLEEINLKYKECDDLPPKQKHKIKNSIIKEINKIKNKKKKKESKLRNL